MEIIIHSEDQIKDVVPQLILEAGDRKVWLFTGDLGAGKTTIIQHIVKHLGSSDDATSPTFSLINEYQAPDGIIYHMDLYRIKSAQEALNLGILEYIDSGAFCLIEWPEIAGDIFEDEAFKIQIEILELNARKVILQ